MKVKIGGIGYEVITTEDIRNEDGEELCGQIDPNKCTIKLDRTLCPQARRQALWHEILHGILTQAGHHDQLKDELLDALAYGIIGILQDNPDLRELDQGPTEREIAMLVDGLRLEADQT